MTTQQERRAAWLEQLAMHQDFLVAMTVGFALVALYSLLRVHGWLPLTW